MLNHIVLMGRLTRDPELRHTQNGVPVASFSIAVDRDFAPKDGGEKQTDFVNIVAWRNTAEFVSKYFSKGRMAVVSGRLQIRDYQDKEGNKRTIAEVVADNVYFGDSKRDSDGGSYSGGYNNQGGGYNNQGGGYNNQNSGYNRGQSNSGYGNQGGGYQAADPGFSEFADNDGDLPF